MKLSEQLQRHFRAPALDLRDGRIVEGELGDTHADIMAGLSTRDQQISNIGHGFVDHNSNFHSRENARLFLRRRGVNIPDQSDEGPSSEMLRGDFDTQYPAGYPEQVRGGVDGDEQRSDENSERSSSLWYKSGQRTIHRFSNGYGASVVGPDGAGRHNFAVIKFTGDAQNPFFIHYATPIGAPRMVAEHEIHPLLMQILGFKDDEIHQYMKGVK